MRKVVSVFSHDSNPAIDQPSFFISRTEADARIDKGYAVWRSPRSIQTRAPAGWTADRTANAAAGVMSAAWQPRFSDHYIVLQLVRQE